jgi:hypothetical protein
MLRYKITLKHKTNMPEGSSVEYYQEYFMNVYYQGDISGFARLLCLGLNAEEVDSIELQGVEPETFAIQSEGLDGNL